MSKLDRVDIIIPTWDNPEYLLPCLVSILQAKRDYPIRVIVVNNGHPSIKAHIPEAPELLFVQAPKNLGWEGGLKLGLEHSDAKFVMFCNDDVFIPASSRRWIRNMMCHFKNTHVGAVGPISNCVMGPQNIWNHRGTNVMFGNYLIGFCMLLRRAALDEAGGVDETMPGGDDIDLSMRLRKANYALAIERSTFVFHHGFKTGDRVHGNAGVAGGWNSPEMSERTQNALIKKHGFAYWFQTVHLQPEQPDWVRYAAHDIEGMNIRQMLKPGSTLELGCGGVKTVPDAYGVDMFGKGEYIDTIGMVSVADCKADALDLPESIGKFDNIIARHIIEHCVNPIETIRHWKRFLKPDGRLIIAVPDEAEVESVPTNPEHKHAFTRAFMECLLDYCGLHVGGSQASGNEISFITCAIMPTVELEPLEAKMEATA